jgi:hypothetical protein
LITRTFKNIRLQFYPDEYANWEREYLGQVKISLEGIPLQEPAAATVG